MIDWKVTRKIYHERTNERTADKMVPAGDNTTTATSPTVVVLDGTDEEDEEDTTSTMVDLSVLDNWNKTKDGDSFVIVQPKTKWEQLTSREAFVSRLQTFLPLTYFCKPTSLSPLVFARFGYVPHQNIYSM
jgi:hypothetical protein